MTDLRDKIRLNQGELPAPRHDLTTPLVSGGRLRRGFTHRDRR